MASQKHSKGANRASGPTPAQVAGGAARAHGLAAVAWAAGLAGALGRRALRAATGETGRRLARAAALTVALAVLVGALYDRGDVPTAAAQPGVGATAGSATHGGSGAAGASSVAGGSGGGSGKAAARRPGPEGQGGLRGRTRPAAVGERPADVAAAWYAARHGAARSKVKPLQQDRLSAREVRVLVLADLGHGRLRTDLVRVRRGPDGWRVR
jgi:hypothetical protein